MTSYQDESIAIVDSVLYVLFAILNALQLPTVKQASSENGKDNSSGVIKVPEALKNMQLSAGTAEADGGGHEVDKAKQLRQVKASISNMKIERGRIVA